MRRRILPTFEVQLVLLLPRPTGAGEGGLGIQLDTATREDN